MSERMNQRPELDDTFVQDWFIMFSIYNPIARLNEATVDNFARLLEVVPADYMPACSIDEATVYLSFVFHDRTQKHTVYEGYATLITAFESIGQAFAIRKAILYKMVEMHETSFVKEPDFQDITLYCMDLERDMAAIRDIEQLE